MDEKDEKEIERKPKKNLNLSNTFSFKIDIKAQSGEEFSGEFTVHRPTIGERIRIGVAEAQELAGLSNIDMDTAILARTIATFDVIVDKAPAWWKPRELRDVEVLQAVWKKYSDYLQEFQRRP